MANAGTKPPLVIMVAGRGTGPARPTAIGAPPGGTAFRHGGTVGRRDVAARRRDTAQPGGAAHGTAGPDGTTTRHDGMA